MQLEWASEVGWIRDADNVPVENSHNEFGQKVRRCCGLMDSAIISYDLDTSSHTSSSQRAREFLDCGTAGHGGGDVSG